MDFLDILERGRTQAFTHRRDHLYGFLALPEADGIRHLIQPSYDMELADIYTGLARHYIETGSNIKLLASVHHNEIFPIRQPNPFVGSQMGPILP